LQGDHGNIKFGNFAIKIFVWRSQK